MRDGRVVASVHDVAASTLEESRWLIERLSSLGARPLVIKVIPSPPSAALGDLVREEQRRGSQIVLHGLTHRADGAPRGALALRIRAALFAPGVAEMLDLDGDALAARVRAGRELLRDTGVHVDAFCAPGWLAPRGMEAALRAEGFRYHIGMATVTDLRSGRVRWVPPLGYMGAGELQEDLIAMLGVLTLAARPLLPAVKVFVHPQGARTSRAAARALDTIAQLLRERRPATYAEIA